MTEVRGKQAVVDWETAQSRRPEEIGFAEKHLGWGRKYLVVRTEKGKDGKDNEYLAYDTLKAGEHLKALFGTLDIAKVDTIANYCMKYNEKCVAERNGEQQINVQPFYSRVVGKILNEAKPTSEKVNRAKMLLMKPAREAALGGGLSHDAWIKLCDSNPKGAFTLLLRLPKSEQLRYLTRPLLSTQIELPNGPILQLAQEKIKALSSTMLRDDEKKPIANALDPAVALDLVATMSIDEYPDKFRMLSQILLHNDYLEEVRAGSKELSADMVEQVKNLLKEAKGDKGNDILKNSDAIRQLYLLLPYESLTNDEKSGLKDLLNKLVMEDPMSAALFIEELKSSTAKGFIWSPEHFALMKECSSDGEQSHALIPATSVPGSLDKAKCEQLLEQYNFVSLNQAYDTATKTNPYPTLRLLTARLSEDAQAGALTVREDARIGQWLDGFAIRAANNPELNDMHDFTATRDNLLSIRAAISRARPPASATLAAAE